MTCFIDTDDVHRKLNLSDVMEFVLRPDKEEFYWYAKLRSGEFVKIGNEDKGADRVDRAVDAAAVPAAPNAVLHGFSLDEDGAERTHEMGIIAWRIGGLPTPIVVFGEIGSPGWNDWNGKYPALPFWLMKQPDGSYWNSAADAFADEEDVFNYLRAKRDRAKERSA